MARKLFHKSEKVKVSFRERMNRTLIYLSLSLFSTSPICSTSSQSTFFLNTFNDLQISNLFQTFYYSSARNSPNPQLYILNSKFTKLLSRAITIDREILSDFTPTVRKTFTFDHNIIINSKFIDISNPTNSGGAILSFSSFELRNCLFDNCEASEGGAFASYNYFNMTYVSFHKCQASTQSAAFQTCYSISKSATSILHYNTLADCRAKYFGAFLKKGSKLTLSIAHSNITNVRASECVGCFENQGGYFFCKYSIISKSSAKVHNGGIVTRGTDNIDIQSCAFYRCKHKSYEPNAAAALLIYENPFSSLLSNSFFIFCNPSNSYTITVSNGSPNFRLINCRFTGEQSKEIRSNNLVKVDSETVFSFSDLCNLHEELEDDTMTEEKDNQSNIVCSWKNSMIVEMNHQAFGYHSIRSRKSNNNNHIDSNRKSGTVSSERELLYLNVLNIIAIFLSLLMALLLYTITFYTRKFLRSCKNRKENQ